MYSQINSQSRNPLHKIKNLVRPKQLLNITGLHLYFTCLTYSWDLQGWCCQLFWASSFVWAWATHSGIPAGCVWWSCPFEVSVNGLLHLEGLTRLPPDSGKSYHIVRQSTSQHLYFYLIIFKMTLLYLTVTLIWFNELAEIAEFCTLFSIFQQKKMKYFIY